MRGYIGMNWNEEVFVGDLNETLSATFKKNPHLRKIAETQKSSSKISSIEDLVNLPFVMADSYKLSLKNFPKMLCVPIGQIEAWTLSSATSGDPSVVGRSKEDIHAYVESYKRAADLNAPHEVDESYMFVPHPDILRARGKEIMGKPAYPFISNVIDVWGLTKNDKENKHYLLVPNKEKGTLDVNPEPLLKIKDEEKTYLIGGSVPILYTTIIKLKEQLSYEFGDSLYIQVGSGGWDGKKGTADIGRKITHKEFVENLSKIFGIPTKNISDNYGTSESPILFSGTYDTELEEFVYKVPGWAYLIIRDPITFEPTMEVGKEGIPQIITPYGVNSYLGLSIIASDLIKLVGFENNDKNRPLFTIKGRLKSSNKTGCGAIISNLVGGE